jgi:DNA ligase-1
MKKLKYPVAATTKLDGIRALRLNNFLLSRTLKQIPNIMLGNVAFYALPQGMDMELYSSEYQFNEIDSIVMSSFHVNEYKINFHLLDNFLAVGGYIDRMDQIKKWLAESKSFIPNKVNFEYPTICNDANDLFAFEKTILEKKGEGICFRLLDSPYKQGRSTLKEQYLIKLARYVTAEAEIIDLIEQQTNLNKATLNNLHHTKRSSMSCNKFSNGILGAFVCRIPETGVIFKIGTGTGLTQSLRLRIWEHPKDFIGKFITYKSKAHGKLIKPKSPVFLCIRKDI